MDGLATKSNRGWLALLSQTLLYLHRHLLRTIGDLDPFSERRRGRSGIKRLLQSEQSLPMEHFGAGL